LRLHPRILSFFAITKIRISKLGFFETRLENFKVMDLRGI
jgi:hypothetical protein